MFDSRSWKPRRHCPGPPWPQHFLDRFSLGSHRSCKAGWDPAPGAVWDWFGESQRHRNGFSERVSVNLCKSIPFATARLDNSQMLGFNSSITLLKWISSRMNRSPVGALQIDTVKCQNIYYNSLWYWILFHVLLLSLLGRGFCKSTVQKLSISIWGECESTLALYQPQKGVKSSINVPLGLRPLLHGHLGDPLLGVLSSRQWFFSFSLQLVLNLNPPGLWHLTLWFLPCETRPLVLWPVGHLPGGRHLNHQLYQHLLLCLSPWVCCPPLCSDSM